MSGVGLAYLVLGSTLLVPSFVNVPVWLHMLFVSYATIYIGSKSSILPQREAQEAISSQDAYMFPVIASGALFGLYLLFMVFSKEYVNKLLTIYIIGIGLMSFTSSVKPLLAFFLPENSLHWSASGVIPIPFKAKEKHPAFHVTLLDILSWVIGIALCSWYVYDKHWAANNIFGMSFCIQGVEIISLGSLKVGCILLGGLFFYDIFWVFGTDVMVTVAKSFDGPIKFLFPKDISTIPVQYSMLGLGDVVIPGAFVALLLRLDMKRAKPNRPPTTPYFLFGSMAYLMGLITTVIVMNYFQAAQPALLYLVPACIGSVLILGAIRGELTEIFAYSEVNEEAKDDPNKGS